MPTRKTTQSNSVKCCKEKGDKVYWRADGKGTSSTYHRIASHLPTLQYHLRHKDMVMMYNIMHGRSGLDKDDLFSPAPSTRTRCHQLKVAKKPAISHVRRNHFATRIVPDWNAPPEDIVCSPSVNELKNLLDKHWKEYAFIAP